MGKGSWKDIPNKYKPHWSTWKIEGTPLEQTQKSLHARGLRDPWIRNEVWAYRLDDGSRNVKNVLRRGLFSGFVVFIGVITLEKLFSSGSSHH